MLDVFSYAYLNDKWMIDYGSKNTCLKVSVLVDFNDANYDNNTL